MRTPGRLLHPLSSTALSTILLSTAALTGCGGDGSGVHSIYVVPASLSELSDAKFFDQPWPNDLRIEDGGPRFAGFPNPRGLPIIDQYIGSTKGVLEGFSPAAAGFVRFEGPIDPSSLPSDPRAAAQKGASVQLIDIDPKSPEHGQKKLVSLRWQEAAGVYYQANTLAFMPTIGFPLRHHTRYAFVVTNKLQAKSGGAIEASDDLKMVLGVDDPDERTRTARNTLGTAVAELENLGFDRENIVHLAVFTTSDPTQELYAVADDVPQNVAPPTAADWFQKDTNSIYDEYTGNYGPSPNYQVGTLPFEVFGDGGAFQILNGKPKVVDTFGLRFSLVVPHASKCPVPPAGYPIVLYAHGTGGDFRSFIKDGTAASLAKQCVASMGVDQIFHGLRPGAPVDGDDGKIQLLFFNFQNPIAARTNGRQSAIDEIQRARLFTDSHVKVPAAVSVTKKDISFDASKLMFFGHSQGGLNGPLFLASGNAARGGVLSGSGAEISIALLEKTEPQPSVAGVVKTVFLGLKGDEEIELDEFHPAISLAQAIVDVVDPLHYARNLLLEPRPGFAPKSIYMTEGINPDGTGDSYAPPHGIEAHGLAIGLPLQLPNQRPIIESQWGGPQPIGIPPEGLAGNLAAGGASGVLAQWAVPIGQDGHYVVFDVSEAKKQAAVFLKNLADDPVGRVPLP